jgi:hypothetical protein
MGMLFYIFMFVKTVVHGLLYSLVDICSNTNIWTLSALIDTYCVIRGKYISKWCYFTSLHTTWQIWSSFYQTVIKVRYSAFLFDYVKGMHRWTLIRVYLQTNIVCCRMKVRCPIKTVTRINMHMWHINVKYALIN